jgi:Xaa-Pro aminopeptidase
MALQAQLTKAGNLKPMGGLVEQLRAIKDEEEIAKIRESVRINSAAFDAALRGYRPGMRESELAAEIDYRQRKLGAEGSSFDTIVASGERSAYPHARPTHTAIEHNALLLIDMGALHEGYASDMTRVVFTGAPGRKEKGLYRAVLDAQLAAIDAIRPDVPAAAVDAAARESLKSRQLHELFTHSTGHGVGLEIHEGPSLRKRESTRLRAGMVITVEPGVYQPGMGGIRIEDIVLVTARGCEVLTPTVKELTSIE